MENIIEAIEAKLQSQKDDIYFKGLQINDLKKRLEEAETEIACLVRKLEKIAEGENNGNAG